MRRNKGLTIGAGLLLIVTIIILFFGFLQNEKRESVLNKQAIDYEEKQSNRAKETILSDDEIYIDFSNDRIMTYHNNDRNNYTGYQFERLVKELDPSALDANHDIWRVVTAAEYSRNDFGKFQHITDFTVHGEWEMAIKEVGANDFMGGSVHGDEVLTSYQVIIDNEEYNDGAFRGKANTLSLVVESDLYRDTSIHDDLIKAGTHLKKYIVDSNGITISQEVKFLEELEIESAYLAMWPLSRDYSHTIISNDNHYDISEDGSNVYPEQTNTIQAVNEDDTIEFNIEILETNSPVDGELWVWNAEIYNKIYSNYITNNYFTGVDEVWSQTTRYEINAN